MQLIAWYEESGKWYEESGKWYEESGKILLADVINIDVQKMRKLEKFREISLKPLTPFHYISGDKVF